MSINFSLLLAQLLKSTVVQRSRVVWHNGHSNSRGFVCNERAYTAGHSYFLKPCMRRSQDGVDLKRHADLQAEDEGVGD
jgi:hypothetical protein